MCILFVYIDPDPPKNGFKLIVASNRDESYKRPAKSAFHCDQTHIIGGRDMEYGREGGMWLGLSFKSSRLKFATLLNAHSDQVKTNAKGRGPLVKNYLSTEDSAEDYLQHLDSKSYNSFYLVLLEIMNEKIIAYHHSNASGITRTYNGKQILAFGNSEPSNPLTKVKNGRILFENIVTGDHRNDRNRIVDELLTLLKSQTHNLPDVQLESRSSKYFPELSQICVKCEGGGYGTRTHTIILVDANSNVEFIEHTLEEPIEIKNPKWNITTIKSKMLN